MVSQISKTVGRLAKLEINFRACQEDTAKINNGLSNPKSSIWNLEKKNREKVIIKIIISKYITKQAYWNAICCE